MQTWNSQHTSKPYATRAAHLCDPTPCNSPHAAHPLVAIPPGSENGTVFSSRATSGGENDMNVQRLATTLATKSEQAAVSKIGGVRETTESSQSLPHAWD